MESVTIRKLMVQVVGWSQNVEMYCKVSLYITAVKLQCPETFPCVPAATHVPLAFIQMGEVPLRSTYIKVSQVAQSSFFLLSFSCLYVHSATVLSRSVGNYSQKWRSRWRRRRAEGGPSVSLLFWDCVKNTSQCGVTDTSAKKRTDSTSLLKSEKVKYCMSQLY